MVFSNEPYTLKNALYHPENIKSKEITEAEIRNYNEGVFIRILDSLWNMSQFAVGPWENEIRAHIVHTIPE